jgi:hypothetical protein
MPDNGATYSPDYLATVIEQCCVWRENTHGLSDEDHNKLLILESNNPDCWKADLLNGRIACWDGGVDKESMDIIYARACMNVSWDSVMGNTGEIHTKLRSVDWILNKRYAAFVAKTTKQLQGRFKK